MSRPHPTPQPKRPTPAALRRAEQWLAALLRDGERVRITLPAKPVPRSGRAAR
jgi:hypothetical protein